MESKAFISKAKVLNAAFIVLALIIAYNAIYKRQVKEVESLKQEINEQIRKAEVLDGIVKKERTINAYSNLLPKKDANIIINTISNIATHAGIKIMSISPKPERRGPDYIKIPFDLTLIAPDYHSFGKFVSDIENYADVFMVESVRISSQPQAAGLTINLKVSSVVIAN